MKPPQAGKDSSVTAAGGTPSAAEEGLRSTRYLHLLACPRCRSSLKLLPPQLHCPCCGQAYPEEGGIPQLAWSPEALDTRSLLTQLVRAFYEQHPFPDYEQFEDLASLMDKARDGVFVRLLDEQIPFGVRVLDCGCGTGQLTNFLGVAHRTVFGTDLSLASLRLGEAFRRRHDLERVFFLQMNLFHPSFLPSSFDYIICNGVLHHTPDPRGGLQTLATLLRPGGFLVAGLYHRYGRLATHLRRHLFRCSGTRWQRLDPRIRRQEVAGHRLESWFADQYQNPHESSHTIGEVLQWLPHLGLDLVKSIPKTRLLSEFTPQEPLFESEPPGNSLERSLVEIAQIVGGDREGGFFTIIARKHS